MSPRADRRPLRVGYAGDDSFITCLRVLLDRVDVELAITLTAHDDRYTTTVERLSLAAGAKVIPGNPGASGWDEVDQAELDLLISAAYGYRIPVETLTSIPVMVNVHPSMLPQGRGPNPLPHIADGHLSAAGVTIHLLDSDFDTGPILLQQRLPDLGPTPSLNDLTLAAMATAPTLLTTLLDDLDAIVADATPQGPGSYWPAIDEAESTIDLRTADGPEIERVIHRFACQGFSVRLDDGSRLELENANFTSCPHDFRPGRLLGGLRGDVLLSAVGGLLRGFPFRDDSLEAMERGPMPDRRDSGL